MTVVGGQGAVSVPDPVAGFLSDVVNGGNIGAIDTYLDPNFVDHDPGAMQAEGSEGLAQSIQQMLSTYPDFEQQIVDVISTSNEVWIRSTASMTPVGGNSFTMSGIDIFAIANNLITDHWGRWGIPSQ